MNQTLHTRRNFLRTSFLGGAAAWTVPVFLERTFFALDAVAADSTIQTATGRDHPILVVVQLAGGNDGLNTLVPYGDDAYYAARPALAIPGKEVLRIDDALGLNPALSGLRSLYDEGLAAVVRGVGYPNPNRSHFRSTDIWQTGSDSNRYENHGWIGRYFDACCRGEDPPAGVAVGKEEPLAFAAGDPNSIAFSQPAELRFNASKASDPESMDESFREMTSDTDTGGSIGALPGAKQEGDASDFLRRAAMDAQLSSDKVRDITSKFQTTAPFPSNRLGNDLALISKLIAGGMPTRVYYASQGGYDTHGGQRNTHTRLLTELDSALSAFLAEMKAQKNLNRVMVMTFSEFGRRVKENASGGTDHGTAAPLFVMGGGVKAGLYGKQPDLINLDKGDLIHTTDFRSVYATLLEKWLRAPSAGILRKQFPNLGFI